MLPEKSADETRITATLPTATVEMVMREHQGEGSEMLTISRTRATPSFQAISQAFRPEAPHDAGQSVRTLDADGHAGSGSPGFNWPAQDSKTPSGNCPSRILPASDPSSVILIP